MSRKSIELNIEHIELDKLKSYKRNNKKHVDFDIGEIAKSIEKYGMNDPIGIWKDNQIIEGHGRLEACKRLGIDKVPCIRLDHLTDKERREYAILHNKTAELAEYDFDNLAAELPDLDFSDFDFDFGIDVDDEEQTEIIEDEVPEVDEENEPTVKLGDIWQLGRHRLMCGDSTDKATVEKLLNGNKADLLLTDPPYGINADKGFSGQGGFNGNEKPIPRRKYDDEWDKFTPSKECFDIILSHCKNAIIFGGNFFTEKIPQGNHWLVWNKHNTMPTFSDGELAWTNIKRNSVKIYDIEYNGLIGKEKERFHPTQKPIKLFVPILQDYSDDNYIIADFFSGSGSTLIACEQLDRICYAMELDPKYCDVIIKRWETLTGEKAVKIN